MPPETTSQPPLPRWLQITLAITTSLTPIALLIGGFLIQSAIQQQSTDPDYVRMAVSILQDQNVSTEFKSWATALLNETSPVRFQESLSSQLNSGTILFPRVSLLATSTGLFFDFKEGDWKVSQ